MARRARRPTPKLRLWSRRYLIPGEFIEATPGLREYPRGAMLIESTHDSSRRDRWGVILDGDTRVSWASSPWEAWDDFTYRLARKLAALGPALSGVPYRPMFLGHVRIQRDALSSGGR